MPKTNQIKIVFSETSDAFIIPQMKITDAFKYLYIKYTLTGCQQLQLLYTTSHAINGARLISASPFTRQQLKLYLLTHLIPKLTYSLSCASFSESQYFRLHKICIPTAILVLRYNHHCPLTLRYDKHPYGASN